jgi:ankyrin repeat protein
VKYLLTTYKFDLESCDQYNCTALHHACWENHPRIIFYLLKYHANINSLNNLQQSPLDVCQTNELRELVVAMILHHERGETEPMELTNTAPPLVSQERVSDDHEAYLTFIDSLRETVSSMKPVGKGIETTHVNHHLDLIPSPLESTLSASERKPLSSFFDEIKNEFEQNHSSLSFSFPNEKSVTPTIPNQYLLTQNGDSHHIETLDHTRTKTLTRQDNYSETLISPRIAEEHDSPDSRQIHSASEDKDFLEEIPEIASQLDDEQRATINMASVQSQYFGHSVSNPMPSDEVQSLVWSICKSTGDVSALKSLVKSYPEALHVSLRDSNGSTPLHCAIDSGYVDIVPFLLLQRAYISSVDHFGNHPIHLACRHGTLDVVRVLVHDSNGSLELVNGDGQTALDVAKMYHHQEIVKYLEEIHLNPSAFATLDNETTLESDVPAVIAPHLIVYHEGDCYLGLTDRPEYVEQMEEEDEENENDDDLASPKENFLFDSLNRPFESAGSVLIGQQNLSLSPLPADTSLLLDDQDTLTASVESRKPLIEICNGVIFEETFDDDDEEEEEDHDVDQITSGDHTVIEETISQSTQTDTWEGNDDLRETEKVDTMRLPQDVESLPTTTSLDSRWLPLLLSSSRILSLREGSSVAKRFLFWKTLLHQSPPRRRLTFCEMLKSFRICVDHLERMAHYQIKREAFSYWKLIPSLFPQHTRVDDLNHISTPYPHSLQHTVESISTPFLENEGGFSPNIPDFASPATPQTDSRVVQRLRFSEVVDISIVEPLQEMVEEDLTVLGPLPIETLPLFKANEVLQTSSLSASLSVSLPLSLSLCLSLSLSLSLSFSLPLCLSLTHHDLHSLFVGGPLGYVNILCCK